MIRALRRLARRATPRWDGSVRAGQWAMSAALAFSHGANDAQKAVGVIAALLLAAGRDRLARGADLGDARLRRGAHAGTALGGWRIIRTVGRRIYRIQPIEGLASQTSSAGVIFGASLLGAPDVDAPGRRLVGGRDRRRAPAAAPRQLVGRRARSALAWLVTIPVTAALAAATLEVWRWLT